MLYPKNFTKEISPEVFKNPPCEYRATPFWAWNTKLNQSLLNMEIDCMKEMGFGGFHMHTRVGMATKYLSSEFMQFIKNCTEKAKKEDMLAWLYDEDKWPSGYAGGYVTKEEKYRQKHILFTTVPYGKNDTENEHAVDLFLDCSAWGERTGNGTLLAKYGVKLDDEGYLEAYKTLEENESFEGDIWYAYLETAMPSAWFNNQTYVDTLCKEAIDKFIEITHETYKKEVGNSFGGDIPAIFTDEPQFSRKITFKFAKDKSDITLPFTTDFEETFKNTYGESFLEKLPEVFWDMKDKISVTRYRFHDHLAEKFVTSFADNVGGWCKKNGLMLTGHVMEEPTLESQTHSTGEAMRSYRSFGLPGVDMLCNCVELTTVKQAASAAHQYGCPGVTSELYGVTNWNFDFRGHKLQGDWQAALGVSVRVPHLYWVAMGGEAKRDYPASIGHQSPWYKEYSFIENHFARVNSVMTRGTADIKIAVVHPIESYWLHYGPNDLTKAGRDELNKRFLDLTEWLLYNNLDFDFVSESLLQTQYKETAEGFCVGKMKYDAVLVPSMETIRFSTLEKLEKFNKNGGDVIFAGDIPYLVDAEPSKAPLKFSKKCNVVPWKKTAILSALNKYRTVEILDNSTGTNANNLVYGMRNDGNGKNLFICHVTTNGNKHITKEENYTIKVKGTFAPTLLNTENGEFLPIKAVAENGYTTFNWDCYTHSSILVRLENGIPKTVAAEPKTKIIKEEYIKGSVNYSLSEPNVYMLDLAEWAIDEGEYEPMEESLKICDKAKLKLGYPLDGAAGCQPWVTEKEPETPHTLHLKYKVNSDIMAEGLYLALENLDKTEIEFNGKTVEAKSVGKYVDIDIDKVALPIVKRGENELVLHVKFGPLTCIENSFILGDFAVELNGTNQTLKCLPEKIYFGDITSQGFPFYGGNIIYEIGLNNSNNDRIIKLDTFEAPLVTAYLNKEKIGVLALAPYEALIKKSNEEEKEETDKKENVLRLQCFGSRINTFGALHNTDKTYTWYGPPIWRTTGASFSYEYQLSPCGILTSPRILTVEEN